MLEESPQAATSCVFLSKRKVVKKHRLLRLELHRSAENLVKTTIGVDRGTVLVNPNQRVLPVSLAAHRDAELFTERLEVEWVPSRQERRHGVRLVRRAPSGVGEG